MEKCPSKQTVNIFRKMNTVPKATKVNNNNSTFVSPIYAFSLAGKILFTRQFKVQLGKSTLIILSIKEKCRLWREIKTSPSTSPSIDRVFPICDRKRYNYNPLDMDIKVVIPEPTQ